MYFIVIKSAITLSLLLISCDSFYRTCACCVARNEEVGQVTGEYRGEGAGPCRAMFVYALNASISQRCSFNLAYVPHKNMKPSFSCIFMIYACFLDRWSNLQMRFLPLEYFHDVCFIFYFPFAQTR
jgi:hypothetical protein